MKIVVCTIKSWNVERAIRLASLYRQQHDIRVISEKAQLTTEVLEDFQPDYVFFPHWSWIIPEKIFKHYECIVFHMTDLPFGRGGSPLQNLIVRGYKETYISAIRVDQGIDTGDIYTKYPLSLYGTAEEILMRASEIIFSHMIPDILAKRPVPTPQTGEGKAFPRRRPEDGMIRPEQSIEEIYDYIRMLDGEGYPPAFIDFGPYRLSFSRASLRSDGLVADVKIQKREDHT